MKEKILIVVGIVLVAVLAKLPKILYTAYKDDIKNFQVDTTYMLSPQEKIRVKKAGIVAENGEATSVADVLNFISSQKAVKPEQAGALLHIIKNREKTTSKFDDIKKMIYKSVLKDTIINNRLSSLERVENLRGTLMLVKVYEFPVSAAKELAAEVQKSVSNKQMLEMKSPPIVRDEDTSMAKSISW
jgi:hypothetical protein